MVSFSGSRLSPLDVFTQTFTECVFSCFKKNSGMFDINLSWEIILILIWLFLTKKSELAHWINFVQLWDKVYKKAFFFIEYIIEYEFYDSSIMVCPFYEMYQ